MTDSLQNLIQTARDALARFSREIAATFHSGLERLQLACEFAVLRARWRYDIEYSCWAKDDRVICPDPASGTYWLVIVLDGPRRERTQHIRFTSLHEAMKAERLME